MGIRTDERMALAVATGIFALVALAQFWRAFGQVPLTLADHAVPIWLSVIGGVVAAFMAFWLGSMLRRHRPII